MAPSDAFRSNISDSGLVKLPPRDEKDSTLDDTEESEKPEHEVEGLLILSPWLQVSIISVGIIDSCVGVESYICAQGVRGEGEGLVFTRPRGFDTIGATGPSS